jgi:DNA repair exonuclease SbcCD nuclease subunit
MTRGRTASRDIVLVHSSDLHVDARTLPNGALDGTANLEAVLRVAQRVGADLVLLAGDTFESHRQPDELLEKVAALIAESRAPVVMLPGNHDPVVPDAVYGRLLTATPLHVLGFTHGETLEFPELGLEVWGRPHRDYSDMIPLETVRERSTRWQVVMAHGHYDPKPDRSTRLRPSWLIGDDELAATRSDYVALGHWNRAVSVGDGRVRAHYSGSPDYAGTVNVIRLDADGGVHVSADPVDAA